MDFVTNILAKLFDSFKAKNPKVAALIIVILSMLLVGLESEYAVELLGVYAQRAIQLLLFLRVALQGSRTTTILHPELKQLKK